MELQIGSMKHGMHNLITDVPGVKVGHCTIDEKDYHTGVTIVMPGEDNMFTHKMTAASVVFNGFGKTQGLVQVEELGTIETPIALTSTMNVGLVHDAMVEYMVNCCAAEGFRLSSVNPVVCECNDGTISKLEDRPVKKEHVFSAIQNADTLFEQGDVGAGKGTICYGLKGGIGSSSRVFEIDGKSYTIGVLVQSNYGASADFRTVCLPPNLSECDRGSIIMIVATDLPLSDRQLKRVLRRCSVGMARLGSYIGHGSGEIAVGFTTARPQKIGEHFSSQICLDESEMNIPFRAVGEATEEAILQSMLHAEGCKALDGTEIQTIHQWLEK